MEQEMQIATAHGAAAFLPALKRLLAMPLYTSVLYLWGNMLVVAIAGLVFWALVAALYPADQVGLAAAAISALSLLAMVSTLGLGMGLVSYLPRAGQRAPLLLNSALLAGSASSVLLAAVFLAGVSLWSPELQFLRGQALYALGFVLFVALLTVTYVQDQALIALRSARYVFVKTVVFQLTRGLLPLLLVLFLATFGIVAAMGFAGLLAALYGMWALTRAQPGYRPSFALEMAPLRRMLRFSLANHSADLSAVMPSLLLPIIVIHVLSPEAGAYFYAGWFLSQVFLGVSLYAALSLFAEGSYDAAALAALTRHALALAVGVAAAVSVVVFVSADRLLLLFGHDYSAEATDLLRLVALAGLPAAVTNVYLGVERVRRHLGWLVGTSLLVASVTLATSYVLLPSLGITGAGVGLLAGQGLGAAISAVRLPLILRSRDRQPYEGPPPGGDSPPPPPAGAPTVAVVICALNERESLSSVLPRIPDWIHEVLLVDGHSTDGTRELAQQLRPGLRILEQPGFGKGDALRHGVSQATADIVVTLDADGETDPDEIPRFLAALDQGYDFAKGSRSAFGFADKPRHRRFGNRAIATVCNILYGTRFTDLCSGYNAFWRRITERVDLWSADGWNYEPSIIARVLKAKLKMIEVPQQGGSRLGGRSKLSSWGQAFRAVWVLLRVRFSG
ncbi:MAG: glycosyltransferase [Dehalococcoidia bacterium]|nr:glycosyltransferase [Dehalococcoidia bacterium]